MIELHSNLNPDQVVYVYPKDISAIDVFGSGSNICLTNGCHIAVSETPNEVYRKREQTQ